MNEEKWIHKQLNKSRFFGNRIDELAKEKIYLEGKVNTIKDDTEKNKIYKRLKDIKQKLKITPKNQIDGFIKLDDNIFTLFLQSKEINETRFKLILFFIRNTVSWNTFDCMFYTNQQIQEKTHISRSTVYKNIEWLKERNIIAVEETNIKEDRYNRLNKVYTDYKYVFNPYWDTWIINDVKMKDILAVKNKDENE